MTMTRTLSESLAEEACALSPDRVPPDVWEKAGAALIHGLAIARLSEDLPVGLVLGRAVDALDGEGVGAFADVVRLGGLMHGMTQEDSFGPLHLGPALVPVAVALSGRPEITDEDLLLALVAGYEVGGGLAVDHEPASTSRGFRSSPLYAGMGAAVVAARLMRLGTSATASAIALAAAFAGGNLQTAVEGTDEWRYQTGLAGMHGLYAAALASGGATGASQALEGRFGLFAVFAGEATDIDLHRCLIDFPVVRGLIIKRSPGCVFAQSALIGLGRGLAAAGADGSSDVAVDVRVNNEDLAYPGLLERGPWRTTSGAGSSLPFLLAARLVRGRVTPDLMKPEPDADIRAAMPRIAIEADSHIPSLGATVTVRLDSRAPHSIEVDPAELSDPDWEVIAELSSRAHGEAGKALCRLAQRPATSGRELVRGVAEVARVQGS